MVRERVYRFTVPPLRSLLDYFGPDTTPAAHARVAIDPERSFSLQPSILYFSRCAFASSARPSASSALAMTWAESLVQGCSRPSASSWAVSAASPSLRASLTLPEASS